MESAGSYTGPISSTIPAVWIACGESELSRFDGEELLCDVDWVWKEVGEPLSDRLVESTVKFEGENVMMWSCMFWEGIGYATRIEGKMDAELYCKILDDELQGTLKYYNKSPSDIIFQQDNNSKHTSKKAQTWFKSHDFQLLQWPAQSSDLNLIEHLWTYIKGKLEEYEESPIVSMSCGSRFRRSGIR